MTATPTPLRELPAKWRDLADRIADRYSVLSDDMAERDTLRGCADDLEAALSARDEAGAVDVRAESRTSAYTKALRGPLATPPASGEAGADEPAPPWRCIHELPDSDDLFWFLNGDNIDGPRAPQPGGYDADEWAWFAPCEPPSTRRLAAVAPAGMDGAHNVALKVLAALGHEPKVADRCTAFVPQLPPDKRPPGPASPPIFCCLKAGHEGPHKCNYGGMSWPSPFRESDPVEFREQPRLCAKCRTSWPCPDAQAALAAAPTPPATVGKAADVPR